MRRLTHAVIGVRRAYNSGLQFVICRSCKHVSVRYLHAVLEDDIDSTRWRSSVFEGWLTAQPAAIEGHRRQLRNLADCRDERSNEVQPFRRR